MKLKIWPLYLTTRLLSPKIFQQLYKDVWVLGESFSNAAEILMSHEYESGNDIMNVIEDLLNE